MKNVGKEGLNVIDDSKQSMNSVVVKKKYIL
jgi:hypothetical protein